VIDEYGSVQGLVTLHDILESITGEIEAVPEDRWAVQRDDGSWLLDGQIPIAVLAQHLGLEWPDDEVEAEFQTASGLYFWRLGRIPRTTESIRWQGWNFEVVDMDGPRIDKILASRIDAGTKPGH
jgi:putative hemolysin